MAEENHALREDKKISHEDGIDAILHKRTINLLELKLCLSEMLSKSEGDGGDAVDVENAGSIIKGENKNLHRKDKGARIQQIRLTLGLADSQRTPTELHKNGFDLSEARFKNLKPILDGLAILELKQKAEEEEAGETSSRKKGDNKKLQETIS